MYTKTEVNDKYAFFLNAILFFKGINNFYFKGDFLIIV